MSKIIFQTTSMEIAGGVERVISIWSNYLVTKGYDVEIFTEDGEPSFYNLNKKINIKKLNYFSRIKIVPVFRVIKFFKFLRSLKKGNYVIFNKYIPTQSLYILRKIGLFKDINLIYFAHGDVDDFISFYKKYQTKKIFKTYDKIICLKDELKNKNNMIDRNKIVILPNPISIILNTTANINKKTVLTVGRLSYPKGYDMLIDVWEIVSKDACDWKLNIIGSGELESELKKKVKEKNLDDSICFLGQKKDIEKYYLNSSIFVSSSRYEGQPMVVLEALEAGLPIVSFDILANRSLIDKNGILVECYNIEKMAKAIKELIKNDEKRLIMSKESKIKSKEFSIENIYSKWNEILKNEV